MLLSPSPFLPSSSSSAVAFLSPQLGGGGKRRRRSEGERKLGPKGGRMVEEGALEDVFIPRKSFLVVWENLPGL